MGKQIPIAPLFSYLKEKKKTGNKDEIDFDEYR